MPPLKHSQDERGRAGNGQPLRELDALLVRPAGFLARKTHMNEFACSKLAMPKFGFSPSEARVLSRLRTPIRIQRYLDSIDYNLGRREDACLSPRMVLRNGKANCIEGAIFAAAALRFHGHPPLVVDLTAVRDDDHVIAVFKRFGHWGAVAKSKYTGLRYREPIHRNIRELALSYFEDYFNPAGQKTLRSFSAPVDLSMFDYANWMTTEKSIFFMAEHLVGVKHRSLLTRGMVRNLGKVNPIQREAGELEMRRARLAQRR